MKIYLLLVIFAFVGCNVKSEKKSYQYNPPVIPKSPLSVWTVSLEPRIIINEDRKEIEVTGHSGQSCGIDFQNGQIISYQFISDNFLEMDLNGRSLLLTRELKESEESEEPGIYGNWSGPLTGDEGVGTIKFEITKLEKIRVIVFCSKKKS